MVQSVQSETEALRKESLDISDEIRVRNESGLSGDEDVEEEENDELPKARDHEHVELPKPEDEEHVELPEPGDEGEILTLDKIQHDLMEAREQLKQLKAKQSISDAIKTWWKIVASNSRTQR